MRISALLLGFGIILGSISCSNTDATNTESITNNFPSKPNPKGYVCFRSDSPIVIDGILNEPGWESAPWTDDFVDIEGDAKPKPTHRTRAKMLWDNENLYIGAVLDDPHVWARLKQRDTVIFYDNDFEVFIDPDGDTHAYYELEVNALGTAWDLLLIKPYRDGGPPVNGWDIAGLKVGIHIDGSLNNPNDTDKGWSVEIVLPLSALSECAKGARLPVAGDQWRLGFSRVQWRTLIENGNYVKEINKETGKPYPENNWVWSPQGRINMHMPEMWGIVQFSSIASGKGQEAFQSDPDLDVKWALRMVYYAEFDYFEKHNKYSSSLSEIGINPDDFPKGIAIPVIKATETTFECYLPSFDGDSKWIIYQDSRMVSREIVLSRK
jgi:hypothetical protein